MSVAPAFGGQSMGTDACGTPSVITLGKNQVVNQRERIPRPARMVGFFVFFRLRLRFVVWTGKVNNDNDSSNKRETKNSLLVLFKKKEKEKKPFVKRQLCTGLGSSPTASRPGAGCVVSAKLV